MTRTDHRGNPGRVFGAPLPGADIADRSHWMPAATRPVRAGWYEVRYWSEPMRAWSGSVMRWWDGRSWRFSPDHGPADFASHPRDQWRGRNGPA